MQNSLNIEVSLFGAFRKFDTGKPVILAVPQGAGLSDIRHALQMELAKRHPGFSQQALIDESALADERTILHDNYRLERDARLAILPPVCGG